MKEILLVLKEKKKMFLPICLIVLADIGAVISGLSLSEILNAASSKNVEKILKAIILVLLVWLITLCLEARKEYRIAQSVKVLNQDFKEKLLNCIVHMPIGDFYKTESGKYVSWLTNDLTTLENNYFTVFFKLINYLVLIVISFVTLIIIHPMIALTSLVLLGLMLFLSRIFQKRLTSITQNVSLKQEAFTQIATDQISGFHVFYHLNTLKSLIKTILCSSSELETSKVLLKKKTAIISSIIQFFSILSQCLLLGVTAILYSQGYVAIGIILSIGNLGGTFFNAVNAFISNYTLFKSMCEFKKKFDFDVVNDDIKSLNEDITNLTFQNVSFAYGNKQILKDVNYTFEKRKKYLLSGESGKGKSTILKLIMGDIQPIDGQIMVNQNTIAFKMDLRSKIGYIDQEPYIFNASIKENLLLGEKYADKDLEAILNKVGLYDLVRHLEGNLNYIISDHGKNLSGGQKQRLAIARCLLRKQQFLLVDECTASLDEKNAQMIEDLLLTDDDLTVIMVSHRVSEKTKAYFDKIIYID